MSATGDITDFDYLITSSASKGARVIKTQLGNGYIHRTFSGINKSTAVWSVQFNLLNSTNRAQMEEELVAGSVAGLTWQSPTDTIPRSYLVIMPYTITYPHPSLASIEATFERLYDHT